MTVAGAVADRRSGRRSRRHASYGAFLVHRLSGLALAIFLPIHFLTLGTALDGAAGLDAAIRWTQNPLVHAGETILVGLLAVHMAGGLRVMALEFLPWSGRQKTVIAVVFGFGLLAGLLFLLNLVLA